MTHLIPRHIAAVDMMTDGEKDVDQEKQRQKCDQNLFVDRHIVRLSKDLCIKQKTITRKR